MNGGNINLLGCCGLYCGLCPKYQSKAASRCVGCRLGAQHAWCSIWNCCVKKHKFETCVECHDLFTCSIFLRRKVAGWIPAADNLRLIQRSGVEAWLAEQNERQLILEKLLQHYNDGRSMSFYCKACSRMPVELIIKSVKRTEEKLAFDQVDEADIKIESKGF